MRTITTPIYGYQLPLKEYNRLYLRVVKALSGIVPDDRLYQEANIVLSGTLNQIERLLQEVEA